MFTLVAYVNPISNLDGIIKCQGKSHFEADSNNNLIQNHFAINNFTVTTSFKDSIYYPFSKYFPKN